MTLRRIAAFVLLLSFATLAAAQSPVTLQQDLNSYAGATDVRIGNGGTNEGSAVSYALIAETSTSLALRFAIFQSEGGPVPNGATITSATLSLYKFWGPVTGDSTFKASRLLKSWNESQLTWTQASSGTAWQTAGAQGATDVASTPDGQGTVSTGINQWLDIDVTPGVQAFASGTPNNGWKVAYVSGGDTSKPKEFYSRESGNSTLRPKLTIAWTEGTGGGSLPQEGRAVSTFHSVGLYWTPSGGNVPLSGKGIPLQYRKVSESTWRRGYDMVYDTRAFTVDGQPLEPARGSIVHADAGTPYVVQFGKYDASNNITWAAEATASTWSETFPAGSTTDLDPAYSNGTNNVPAYHITSSMGGNATGYAVYDGALHGTTITANTAQSSSYGIRISASYVIVRNVSVVGGMDAIRIDDGVHDVVIENSDISGWGSRRGDGATHPIFGYPIGANEQAGIRTTPGSSATQHRGIKRIVIQRNRIHDPQFGANTRPYGADGPKHIDLTDTGGNNVIRYNEFYATDGSTPAHWAQDNISGSTNGSQQGAPGEDSDIYMNRVQHCTDDGIEAEGGNHNVRVWKNYTDMCPVGIASTQVAIGPVYIWRNVHNRSKKNLGGTWDGDDRVQAFKAGTFGSNSTGRRFLFHNTVMQLFDSSLGNRGLGHGGGLSGNTNEQVTNTTSRNNIYHHWRTDTSPFAQISTIGNDLDYDMAIRYDGTPAGTYANKRQGTPDFKSLHGPSAFDAGRYQLNIGSPGYDQGELLFNFNTDVAAPHQYLGAAPDVGAHEEGSPDMQFGTAASGN